MLFRFACKRYRSIETNARETQVTRAESDFLNRHAAGCPRCLAYTLEVDALSDALSGSMIEPMAVSPTFTEDIVRGVRAMRRESYRTSFRPVLIGAVAAFVAVGAILQMVGLQPEAPSTDGSADTGIRRESPLDSAEPGDMNLFDTPSRLARDPKPIDV